MFEPNFFLEESDDIIFIFDAESLEIVYANTSFFEFTGASKNNINEIILPDLLLLPSNERFNSEIIQSLFTEKTSFVSSIHIKNSSSFVEFKYSKFQKLFYQDRNYIFIQIYNIQPYIDTVRATEQNGCQEQLLNLINSMPLTALIIHKDAVFVNQLFEHTFGFTNQDLSSFEKVFSLLFRENAVDIKNEYETIKNNDFNKSLFYKLYKKDGTKCSIEFLAFNFKDYEIWFIRERTEFYKTLETLMRNEERFRMIVETANEGIITFDSNWQVCYSNNRMSEILGFTIEEMLGKKLDAFLFEEDYSNQKANMELREKGISQVYEQKFRRKDGSQVWNLVSATPIMDKNNEFAGSFAMFSDISVRKQIEEELKSSEEKYKALFQSVSDGIYITELNGIFISVNQAFCRIFEYNIEELIGKQAWTLAVPGTWDIVYKSFISKVVTNDASAFEVECLTKSKRRIICEISISRATNQKFTFGIVRDITIKKEYERMLEQSEANFRSLAENLPDVVSRTDRNHRYLFINKAIEKITGRLAVDFIGKTDEELNMPEESSKLWKEMAEKAFATGEAQIYDFSYLSHGVIKFFQSYIVPEINLIGEVSSLVNVTRDISDLKNTENRLRDLNQTKDKLFSIISHDLRSPFLGFIGLTDLIIEDYDSLSDEEILNYTKSINRVAKQVYELIVNLLEWSNIQKSFKEYSKEKLSTYELYMDVFSRVEDIANLKKISIHLEDKVQGYIEVNRNMMESVVRNLIINAIKFSNRNSKIEVLFDKKDVNTFLISVKDYGIGMDAGLKSRLFKIGEKVSRPGTEDEPSSGLGLFICKEFVEQHGGNIWCESVPNEGSTFNVTIPL
jgi:PAS domain S-box-containing protein